ncbi:MAG: methylated-DNA--[protein]-cysteine S-methyltransferase [Pseudomonadota bacterium]
MSTDAGYALFPTALGECGIAWRDALIVATSLPERSATETAVRLERSVAASEASPPEPIQRIIELMRALLDGARVELDHVACDFSRVSQFERRVYEITRAIPAGRMRTYGDVASELGDVRLAQSVGRALGRNPFPIVVPCHRVMGANNRPTGFSAYGGVDTKLRMLAIEGAQMGTEPGLFDDL